MPVYEFAVPPVEHAIQILVGGKMVARLLADELKRRNQAIISDTPAGKKPKLLSDAALAREMRITKQTFSKLVGGSQVYAEADVIANIALYFKNRYGEEARQEVYVAFGLKKDQFI